MKMYVLITKLLNIHYIICILIKSVYNICQHKTIQLIKGYELQNKNLALTITALVYIMIGFDFKNHHLQVVLSQSTYIGIKTECEI